MWQGKQKNVKLIYAQIQRQEENLTHLSTKQFMMIILLGLQVDAENLNLNGVAALGENIADNGGIKLAFRQENHLIISERLGYDLVTRLKKRIGAR